MNTHVNEAHLGRRKAVMRGHRGDRMPCGSHRAEDSINPVSHALDKTLQIHYRPAHEHDENIVTDAPACAPTGVLGSFWNKAASSQHLEANEQCAYFIQHVYVLPDGVDLPWGVGSRS